MMMRFILLVAVVAISLTGCGLPNPCKGPDCQREPEAFEEDVCGDGFVLEDGRCVEGPSGPSVATPCLPNPCVEPNRSLCQAVGTGHLCACDPGYADTGEGCVAADSCDTVVTYVPPAGESAGSLFLRGEFNGWSLATPMTQAADGSWRATLQLEAGDYAYKLFDQSGERWFEDPANPFFKWVGGVRNSRLRVRDCATPRLVLQGHPEVTGGRVRFAVRYLDGAERAGVDPARAHVTRNDEAVTAAFDPATGLFVIDDQGLPRGKYAYRIRAADRAGRAAERLFVPVWVEPQPFRWQDAVLYFAFTDRFADGNPGNNRPVDGVDHRANWQGGDFAGLQAKLEAGYFDQLGVNALWLSSVVENTGGAGRGIGGDGHLYAAYHSYWPIATGWRDGHELAGVVPIEPHFGTLAELKALVRAAHARGIRVLVDLVANHVHQDSPLWQQHRYDTPAWYHALYTCGWEQPISCWFTDYLPDFDFTNQAVLDTVVEHAVWLAQEAELDGFRLDAVKHMVHDFPFALRARLNESVATTGERFYLVGETYVGEGHDAATLIRDYVRPEELDGQFDFPLYWQIVTTLLREERDLGSLAWALNEYDGFYGDQAIMGTFLGNHDVPRAISHAAGQIGDMWGNGAKEQGWNNAPPAPEWDEPHARLRLAWTFLLTNPGVPLIYYGDEFGLEGAGDPDNRRFMRFGEQLTSRQQGTLAHVQKLLAARHAHPAFRYGQRRQLHLDDDKLLWAYALETDGDAAAVVLNRKGNPQTRTISVSELGWSTGTAVRDLVHEQDLTVDNGSVTVNLGARDAAVLVRR